MLQQLSKALTPALAAVIIAFIAAFTAIAFWAPPDVREWLFGATGIVWTVTAYLMRSPFTAQVPPPPAQGGDQ